MWNQMLPGLRMTVLFTLLTGLLYPGLLTAICQAVFPRQANGSLIERNGKVIGSDLIGQGFTAPHYFHSRPSAAGTDGYDASSSGGSNLGPTSLKLMDRIRSAKESAGFAGALPADLLTTSASGLDPHISPASARLQAPAVSKARGIEGSKVMALVGRFTVQRDLGFLGEPRVNVLMLNLALDEEYPLKK